MTTLMESISPTSRRLLRIIKSNGAATLRERFNAASNVPLRSIQTAARVVREARREEDCLRYLAQLLGDLSRELLYPHGKGTKEVLQKMFALSTSWMARVQPEAAGLPVLNAVFLEREHQEELRRDNPRKYSFALSSSIPDVKRKLRVVFEECGEVADACDSLEQSPGRAEREHLFAELKQVAACCAAWLESFEVAA